MATTIGIEYLSPEILTEIFRQLPLEDRKNVRLTCSWFYNACNRIPIIQHEKFVLRSGFCIQEITKTLISCQYQQLNLEFQGLPVDTFPAAIWKNCGDKIRCLVLYQCTLSNKAVRNIITQCVNLQQWKLSMGTEEDLSSCRSVSFLSSTKSFDALIKNRVIRKNLNTFDLFISTESGFWSSLIKKIVTIFPNLKTFRASCWCSHGLINFLEPYMYPSFLCTRIDKCLNLALIETLRFDIPTDGRWFKSMIALPSLNLKRIQTSFFHAEKILELMFNFFSKQKQLEVVNLSLSGINEKLLKKLITHILKECSSLRELRLSYPLRYSLEFNQEEYCTILKSDLKSLQLRFNFEFEGNVANPLTLPINQNLQCLVIDSHHEESEVDYSLILKYFNNLKHLELCFATDKILQTIFEYQTKLVKLVLSHIDFCTDYGFTGQKSNEIELVENESNDTHTRYSIKQLKIKILKFRGIVPFIILIQENKVSVNFYDVSDIEDLECLDVNGWCGFTDAAMYEFVFPRLKHFRFALGFGDNKELKTDPLLFIAQNSPLLETVMLDLNDLSQKVLLELCESLKKLYFLDCFDSDIPDLNCAELFRRSSLRFVSYNEEIFCYNPFTGKISVKHEAYLEIKNSRCCCACVQDEL